MAEVDKGDYTYIARKECGCLTMVAHINHLLLKDVAKEVAKAIRLGKMVDRVPTEEVRKMDWLCPTHRAEVTKKAVIERMQGRLDEKMGGKSK